MRLSWQLGKNGKVSCVVMMGKGHHHHVWSSYGCSVCSNITQFADIGCVGGLTPWFGGFEWRSN